MLAISLPMAVLFVGFAIATTQVSGVFIFMFLAFLGLFAWFMYRMLFRRAYELDLDQS